jgi:hypothetical protein
VKEYYQRVSDKVLMDHLESKGAVLIEGLNGAEKQPLQNILQKVS